MGDVVNLDRQHKHVARIMKLVYDDIEARLGDSDYGINVEYDVAIKMLARINHNIGDDSFEEKLLVDLRNMSDSFSR